MKKEIKEVVAFMEGKGVTIEELKAYFNNEPRKEFRFVIDDIFGVDIPVVTGRVESGVLKVGMPLLLVDLKTKKYIRCNCESIRRYRKSLVSCCANDYVAIQLSGLRVSDIKVGMILILRPVLKENIRLKCRDTADKPDQNLKRQNSL